MFASNGVILIILGLCYCIWGELERTVDWVILQYITCKLERPTLLHQIESIDLHCCSCPIGKTTTRLPTAPARQLQMG